MALTVSSDHDTKNGTSPIKNIGLHFDINQWKEDLISTSTNELADHDTKNKTPPTKTLGLISTTANELADHDTKNETPSINDSGLVSDISQWIDWLIDW